MSPAYPYLYTGPELEGIEAVLLLLRHFLDMALAATEDSQKRIALLPLNLISKLLRDLIEIDPSHLRGDVRSVLTAAKQEAAALISVIDANLTLEAAEAGKGDAKNFIEVPPRARIIITALDRILDTMPDEFSKS